MKIIKKFLFLSFLILSISKLYAIDKTNYYSYGNEFDATTVTTLNQSKDSIRLQVPIRVLFDILAFQETYSNDKQSVYSSKIELEIVCTDKGGIIRNRTQLIDTVYAKNFEITNSKNTYHNAYFDLTLPKNDYSIDINLFTNKNKQTITKKVKDIDVNDNYIAESILLYRDNNQKNFYNLSPYIIKNAGLFDNNIISILCNITNTKVQYTYSIEYLNDSENNSIYKFWQKDKLLIDGIAEILENKQIDFKKQLSDLTFNLVNGNENFIKIKLPFERIIPGEYKVIVKSESGIEQTIYFQVEWESKPLTLDNIDYAIDKMYYILTDEELENLKQGSDLDKEKKLMEYWNKLDPTPSTPFNESMFQYFDRVDYAFFNFATLAEKDGADTDRGKVFILNGAPDLISDKNIEGKPGIIWDYQKLNKKYIYKAVASGIYKLIKIEE